MPLYVYALSDTPVMPWEEDDGRRIESVLIEGIHVIADRRATPPATSEAELRRQHAIVMRVSEAVPAVIPARFGSQIDEADLSAILRQRADVIKTTFDRVRDNVQMTLRFAAATPPPADTTPTSGREYLQRRRDDLVPPIPSSAERTLRELRPYVLDERRKADERGVLTVYHLVRRSDAETYRDVLGSAGIGVAVSGPWAPFAFAPDLFA